MQDLIALIRAINISRLKSGGLWSFVFDEGSLMEQLFDAIYAERVSSDEEAVALLYPGEKVGSKFINLRERLKERILNIVFLVDFKVNSSSDRQKAYFECNRKWAAAMLLMSKNAKGVSISVIEGLLKQSIQYEFTELTLSALSSLRLHFGTIYGDASKYSQYREMYRQYQEVWMMENEAEDAYTNLVSNFVNSKASKIPISDEAQLCFDRIAPFLKQSDSFRLHLCGRLIEVMIPSSKNDYAGTAKVCESAIDFFQNKEYESNLALQAFYYQLIVCYIQLQEFEKGEKVIQQYQSIFEEGSFNWYKLQELFFLLAMYTKRYTKAMEVCVVVQQKLQTKSQPAHIEEMWKIYEAYSSFLLHIGKATPPKGFSSKFKVSKFLNEIPTYSKDKQGMNIPILVIQILFNISDGHFNESIDRMEAIDKYCSRYLKQNETFRSSCFIKALMQMPAASFHHSIVEKKAQKYMDMLQTQPLEVAYQSHEIEIIPYEHLWEMAMETLKHSKVKS
jgi:hypothetical protein